MSELKVYKVYTTRSEGAWGYHYEPNPNKDQSDIELNDEQVYLKKDADKYIADLEESHKKEVAQLQMKIAGLEKLVETADKVIKQKGGFTIKDIEFGGVKLEGINTHKKEAEKFKETKLCEPK